MRTAVNVLCREVDDVCNRCENKKKSWWLSSEDEKSVGVKDDNCTRC